MDCQTDTRGALASMVVRRVGRLEATEDPLGPYRPGGLPARQEHLRDSRRGVAHGLAASHGPPVGVYAAAILDTPPPWTKMRQVYRLIGLAEKWGFGARRAGLCPGA